MNEILQMHIAISERQAKNRKRDEKETKIMSKKVKNFEDELRKLKQYKGDCPVCSLPMLNFGSKEYEWDLMDATKDYSDTLLSGSDVRHHDKCFFNRYGHLD